MPLNALEDNTATWVFATATHPLVPPQMDETLQGWFSELHHSF